MRSLRPSAMTSRKVAGKVNCTKRQMRGQSVKCIRFMICYNVLTLFSLKDSHSFINLLGELWTLTSREVALTSLMLAQLVCVDGASQL